MAQILESITIRRARRAISDQPINRAALETLLAAAHLAPSCANNQPWRFVVVDKDPTLTDVKEHLAGGNYWAKTSPVIIAVASKADLDCQIPDGRNYHMFGCGMASMNLMLQATEMGLIAHPIAGFKQSPIKELLSIPDEFTLISLIILGHPASTRDYLSEKHQAAELAPRMRKPLTHISAWNTFSSLEADTT